MNPFQLLDEFPDPDGVPFGSDQERLDYMEKLFGPSSVQVKYANQQREAVVGPIADTDRRNET